MPCDIFRSTVLQNDFRGFEKENNSFKDRHYHAFISRLKYHILPALRVEIKARCVYRFFRQTPRAFISAALRHALLRNYKVYDHYPPYSVFLSGHSDSLLRHEPVPVLRI